MRDKDRTYGRGVTLPLVVRPGFGWAAGADLVAQVLRGVLLTEPGERIGRPAYGVGLRRFLFAPNTLATRAVIRQAILDAVERDEPSIDLDDVAVTEDPAEPTLLRIEVRYRLAGEPAVQSVELPFQLDQSALPS
jgi:uncharacterized protein